MSKFIYFTPEQRRQANETDLPSFLRCRGEKLLLSGREYRLAGDHSITIRGCKWFDHSARKGGRAISFVQTYYDKDYPEAVSMLLGQTPKIISKPALEPSKPKPFALPEASVTMRRVYAYLMRQRHISREVITEFVHEKLLYEDIHHNCVFVGLDADGVAKHAHLRASRRTHSIGDFRTEKEQANIA